MTGKQLQEQSRTQETAKAEARRNDTAMLSLSRFLVSYFGLCTGLIAILWYAALPPPANAFIHHHQPSTRPTLRRSGADACSSCTSRRTNTRRFMYIGDGKGQGDSAEDDNDNSNVMSSNRLSHVMLRVPNVNATLDYWVEQKGATIKQYNKSPSGTETAFVALGNGKEDQLESCFALEITSLPEDEELIVGNGVAYLGTSMLLDFQNNLIGAAAGERIGQDTDEEVAEPNGIEVRRVASGPGDFFARLCLRPRPTISKPEVAAINGEGGGDELSALEITEQFYTRVMGMRVVANDADLLCLRYKDDGFGVSTMLVFSTEQGQSSDEDEEFVIGNMLDRLVISTPNVKDAAKALRDTEQGRDIIFLEPTKMFGTTIMGITDPSGYKLFLAEKK